MPTDPIHTCGGALARPALREPRHAETAGGGAGGCPAAGGGGSRAPASPSAGTASAGLARQTLCSWYKPVQPTNTLAAAKFQLTGVMTNDQRVQMMPVQARAVGVLTEIKEKDGAWAAAAGGILTRR